VTTDKL